MIGKFKDEAAGISLVEFLVLRSKMHSYVKDNGKNEKTAKRIKWYVIKKNTAHHTLQNNKQIYHTMKTIRSVHHQLCSYELNKIWLSCFEKKIYPRKWPN